MNRNLATALPLLKTAKTYLEYLQAPAALAARLFVGAAFFRSGLTKIVDWDTTLALFADEYHVPLLPTDVAAVAGTIRASRKHRRSRLAKAQDSFSFPCSLGRSAWRRSSGPGGPPGISSRAGGSRVPGYSRF